MLPQFQQLTVPELLLQQSLYKTLHRLYPLHKTVSMVVTLIANDTNYSPPSSDTSCNVT